MDQVRIGAFMKSVRMEKGLTQAQLAEKLGVSQKSVSRWETGKTMPDYSLLPGLCEALQINVAELLGAERIGGNSISKNQVTDIAHTLLSMVNGRRSIRKLIGALISAAIMLMCVIGVYNREFHISVDSTADLEAAINAYHFADEVSADVLERQAVGHRLYVLYGEKEYPGACGLACLEKGIFGRYRIVSCDDSDVRWIHAAKTAAGKTNYCITYCASDLPGISAYGLCGAAEGADDYPPADAPELVYKLTYTGSPFLTVTEIDDGVTVYTNPIRYFQGDTVIAEEDLEGVLGDRHAEGAPNSGTGTAELGMIYCLEGILLLLGFVFIRYFLSGMQ